MERAFRSVQAREMKRIYRYACLQIIEAANEIRSSIGAAQNLNYERAGSNAQGAQYVNDGHSFRLIDFTVDVEKAVRDTLTDAEYDFYNQRLKDKDFDEELKVQSSEFLRMQERLGRVFKVRKLWPASKYFAVVKK
jgi:hypothetical protein